MAAAAKKYRGVQPDSLRVTGTALALGAGIGVYFSLPFEPPLAAGPVCAIMLLSSLIFYWRDNRKKVFLLLLLGLAVGFSAATIRSHWVAAPKLARETGPVLVAGTISGLERQKGDDLRLTLTAIDMERPPRAGAPAKIRVTVRTKYEVLAIGDRVEMLTILNPPPEPVAPHAFDFARQAWFDRLGAVGFAISAVKRLESAPDRRIANAINRMRDTIDLKVRRVLTGPSGGLASALLTGLRGGIDAGVQEDMRIAGLAHILAISGLHMGLVSGILFFAVRAFLALIPPLALRFSIKKVAAVGALAGAVFYLVLSGGTVPTQRAFIMVGIALAAVMADRQAISMRTVALAAIVILLIAPESLLSVSFQMSFAAVIALVAAYQHLAGPLSDLRQRWHGPLGRSALFFAIILLTSIIAQLAIEPIAAYHFNRMSTFGIVANLVAVPALGLWILPWGILALVLMPLGLESLALVPMGFGIDLVVWSAHEVAILPGSVLLIPSFPMTALILLILAYLWMILWPAIRWKSLALIPAGLSLLVMFLNPPPDLLIGRDGGLIAVRGRGGHLLFSTLRRESFTRDSWLRRNAQRSGRIWQPEPVRCDPDGCVWRARHGRMIAVVTTVGGLIEDCTKADLVINLARINLPCNAPEITWQDIAREGAHAVWLGSEIKPLSANSARGNRPWVGRGE